MPGLVPGIHVFASADKKDVDGRVKPGHDGEPPLFDKSLTHSRIEGYYFCFMEG